MADKCISRDVDMGEVISNHNFYNIELRTPLLLLKVHKFSKTLIKSWPLKIFNL